jgi:hypothetical protein
MSNSTSANTGPRFVVGIDLGTTNSAVAYVDSLEREAKVKVFPVVQFVAPGEIEAREILPSFHYTPAQGEFAAMRLPWKQTIPNILWESSPAPWRQCQAAWSSQVAQSPVWTEQPACCHGWRSRR